MKLNQIPERSYAEPSAALPKSRAKQEPLIALIARLDKQEGKAAYR